MTLHQGVRNGLRKTCVELRDAIGSPFGWDPAGIDAALLKLDAEFPNNPATISAIAITCAARPDLRTPAAMNDPQLRTGMPAATTKTNPATTPPTKPSKHPKCVRHDSDLWNTTHNAHACCITALTTPDDRPCDTCQPTLQPERSPAATSEQETHRTENS